MRQVTYTGSAKYLRLASGRLIPAGVQSEVTNADADALAGRPDVHIHAEPTE
jgi:hypothetical protein